MEWTEKISVWVLPMTVLAVGGIMLFGKKDYFRVFSAGAEEGLRTTVKLLPTLTALLVAISMLNASGVLDAVAGWVRPAAELLGVPGEILPLLLTRPFSGSASTAAFTSLLSEYGADSFPAFCASVIFGSSDTVVYVLTVYFSSVGVRKTRWAFPAAFAVMLFDLFFSCFLSRMCF